MRRQRGLLEFGQNGNLYRLILVCAVCAILSGVVSTNGDNTVWRWLHYLTKPTTTVLLMIAVMSSTTPGPKSYAIPVAIGLGFGALGDFFLMLPGDYFMAGLICFLLTHCTYIFALYKGADITENKAILAAFTGAAILIVADLWTALPNALKLPVIIYAAALGFMAALAVSKAWNGQLQPAQQFAASLAAAGALLFMISDTLLAYGRFRFDIPLNSLWVLTTYFAAQFLFARSTESFSNER